MAKIAGMDRNEEMARSVEAHPIAVGAMAMTIAEGAAVGGTAGVAADRISGTGVTIEVSCAYFS